MGRELEAFPVIASSESSCPFGTCPVSKGAAPDQLLSCSYRHMDPTVLLYILEYSLDVPGSGFLLELLLEGGVLGTCRVESKGF